MKYKIFLLSVFLIITFTIFVFSAKIPVAVTGDTLYEAGRIPYNSLPIVHVFRLENKGDVPLKILHIQTICECTSYSLSSHTIKPGKTIKIKLTIDVNGKDGEFLNGIKLFTNDPAHPSIPYLISGYVFHPIEIYPSVLNLGYILRDNLKIINPVITVRINTKKINGIEDVKSEKGLFNIRIDKQKKDVYRIVLTFTPNIPQGPFTDELLFYFPGKSKIVKKVPVTGFVRSRIEPSRRVLRISEFLSHYPMYQIVYLSYLHPFKITKIDHPRFVSISVDEIEVLSHRKPKIVEKLKITLLKIPENGNALIRVHTNIPTDPEVVLILQDRKNKMLIKSLPLDR